MFLPLLTLLSHMCDRSETKKDEATGKPTPVVTLTSESGNKGQVNIYNIFVGKVSGQMGSKTPNVLDSWQMRHWPFLGRCDVQ